MNKNKTHHPPNTLKERAEIIDQLRTSDCYDFVTDLDGATEELSLSQLKKLQETTKRKPNDTLRPR
jgi:hypothetical protein